MGRVISHIIDIMIATYQYLISPMLPASCRFYPSCSCYIRQVIKKFGLAQGLGLSLWRVLRCNPWCAGGYDPVPSHTNNSQDQYR